MPNEPTIGDVLSAVNRLDGKVDHLSRGFVNLTGRVDDLAESVQALATHMDARFDKADQHLDQKLDALRADLVLLARRGNTKLSVLIEDLVAQKALDSATARKILALEPFPQI